MGETIGTPLPPSELYANADGSQFGHGACLCSLKLQVDSNALRPAKACGTNLSKVQLSTSDITTGTRSQVSVGLMSWIDVDNICLVIDWCVFLPVRVFLELQ